jgi:hypothetical protein
MHFGKPLIHAAEYGGSTVAGGTQGVSCRPRAREAR